MSAYGRMNSLLEQSIMNYENNKKNHNESSGCESGDYAVVRYRHPLQ